MRAQHAMKTMMQEKVVKIARSAWGWLLRAPSDSTDVGRRRQTRMVSAMLLIYAPVALITGLIMLTASQSVSAAQHTSAYIHLVAAACMAGMYPLNRRGHYRLATISLITIMFILIVVAALSGHGADGGNIFPYLILPLLLSAMLLPPGFTFAFFGATIAGALLLMLLAPAAFAPAIQSLSFVALTSLLVSLSSTYRNSLEGQRRALLETSEARYRALAEQMPAIIYTGDLKNNLALLYVSPTVIPMLGVTPEECVAQPNLWLELVHPDDRARVAQATAQIIATLQPFTHEYRMVSRAGQTRWIRDEAAIVRDEAGRPSFAQGVVVDISNLKATEEVSRQRSQELELLYQASRQLSQMLNLEHIYETFRVFLAQRMPCDRLMISSFDAGTKMIRCDFVWMEGKHMDPSIFPPIPLAEPGRGIQSEVIRTGRSELIGNYTARLKSVQTSYFFTQQGVRDDVSDDEPQTRSAIVAPLILEERVIGVMQLQCDNYNAYTPADQAFLEALAALVAIASANARLYQQTVNELIERRRMEEALFASETQLRAIIESAKDSIFVKDATLTYRLVNPAMCELFQRPAEEILGQTDVVLFGAEASQHIQEMDRRVLAGESVTEEIPRSVLGELHIFSTVKAPLRDSHGKIVGICGIARDITERKRMEEELTKAQKLESVGVLAGGIAHDFNNLLMAILGNLSLARLTVAEKSETYDLLKQAEAGCLRARDLTQQLLTFSKGGAPIKKTSSVAELLRESAAFATRGSKVRCQYDIPDDLWPAEIDAGQINQVIHNLVLNAVQAMPNGGEIQIVARNAAPDSIANLPLTPGPYLDIAIRDQGVGIPPDHLSKIFDPYFTTKQQGSGLGLATVFSIVKRHAGHISVASTLGQGTVFHLYLPANPQASKRVVAPAPAAATRGRGRVLLMEDEQIVQETAERMLRRLGYEVVLVTDGVAALQVYRRDMEAGRRFDAVIMDLTIPGGMGGAEAIGKLLALDPQATALVSSGYFNDPVMADFAAYGFRAVIPKPYEMDVLGQAIQKALAAPQAGATPAADSSKRTR